LLAILVISIWNSFPHDEAFKKLIFPFVINEILNIGWTLLFFRLHSIVGALIEIVFLEISILWIISIVSKRSLFITLFIAPYALWVFFTEYLNYTILFLN